VRLLFRRHVVPATNYLRQRAALKLGGGRPERIAAQTLEVCNWKVRCIVMNVMDLERANGDAISGEGTYPLGSTTPYLEWAVMKDHSEMRFVLSKIWTKNSEICARSVYRPEVIYV